MFNSRVQNPLSKLKWWKKRTEHLKVDLLFVQELSESYTYYLVFSIAYTHTYIYTFLWIFNLICFSCLCAHPVHYRHSRSYFLTLTLCRCIPFSWFCLPTDLYIIWKRFLIIFGAQLSRTCKIDRSIMDPFTCSRSFLHYFILALVGQTVCTSTKLKRMSDGLLKHSLHVPSSKKMEKEYFYSI